MWCSWVVPGDQNWRSTPCSEVRQILLPGILAGLPPAGMAGTSSLVLRSRGEQGPGSVFMELEFGNVGFVGRC